MWTQAQSNAINAEIADNLVCAAAGSGKTAVMAERIVSRVVSGKADIDKILAVTFTNAAASELKSRLMHKIIEQLEKNENTENLNKQLLLMNNASICTIHSFCLDILKNNFHRIGLDPGFKIADPAEIVMMKQDIINKIFEKHYSDGDKVFLSLVDCYTKKNDSALIEIILKIYDFSMNTPEGIGFIKEKAEKYEDDNTWEKECIALAKKYARRAVKMYEEAIEITEFDETFEKQRALLYDEKNMFDAFLSSKSWDEAYRCCSAFEFNTLRFTTGCDEDAREKIKNLRKAAKKLYEKLDQLINESYGEVCNHIAFTAPMVLKLAEITEEFYIEFSKVKKEKNCIDFNDIEHLALSLLKNPDGSASDIALSLSEKFEEIYVDEYQDCNSVQEAIFTLVSRKNQGFPNMFMVGDMKQSIYRFRGSEPTLFKNKSDTYCDYGTGDGKYNKINLNMNFRSRKSILNGANSIFRQLMNTETGELEYSADEYLYYNENSYEDKNPDTDKIDLVLIECNVNDEPVYSDETDDESENAEELKNIEAEAVYIANRINEMVKSGDYLIYDKEEGTYRNVRYSDIAVLLRSVDKYAQSYCDILTTAQIPAYCENGGGYYDTPEIVFLINFLKIIDNPLNDIALLSVMRHPVFSFTDDEFVQIRCMHKKGYFYDSLVKYRDENNDELSEKINDFCDTLKYFYDRSGYLPSDKIIWEITEKTHYMSYLSFLPNPEFKKANVRALFSRANDFEKTDYKGIFNFIRYVDSLKKSKADTDGAQVLSPDEDVVRIMSIHKSKGLEFPVVFLAGCAREINLSDKTKKVLLHKNYNLGVSYIDPVLMYKYPLPLRNIIAEKIVDETVSEEMRVLYVALTRAREKLIIVGSEKNISGLTDRIAREIQNSDEKIDSYVTKSHKSFLMWILLAVMRNSDTPFAKKYCFKTTVSDGSKFDVKMIDKNELILDIDEEGERFDFSSLSPADGADEIIKSRLEYSYPYRGLDKIASNMSVTELKRLENEDEDAYMYYVSYKAKTPSFLSDTDKPSAADIGIITHLVMEKLDFSKISSKKDVENSVKELVKSGFITENQAKYVKCENIYRLFLTPLGKRMSECESTLRREYGFKYLVNASDIYPEITTDEKIVIQGMADAFFEDENGITIVDYKTDKVDNNIDELKIRYTPQLKYYGLALEKSLGKKVFEKYLFLLDSGDVIKIE